MSKYARVDLPRCGQEALFPRSLFLLRGSPSRAPLLLPSTSLAYAPFALLLVWAGPLSLLSLRSLPLAPSFWRHHSPTVAISISVALYSPLLRMLARMREVARKRGVFPCSLARLLAQLLTRPCSRLSAATRWLAALHSCLSAWLLSLAPLALALALAATCVLAPVLVSPLRARAWAVDGGSLSLACALL